MVLGALGSKKRKIMKDLKLIVMAMLHAVLIPLGIYFIASYFEHNLSSVMGVGYWAIVAIIYLITDRNRPVFEWNVARYFFTISATLGTIVLIILFSAKLLLA